jgi:hypothetical protein
MPEQAHATPTVRDRSGCCEHAPSRVLHALAGVTRFLTHPEALLLRCAWCDRFFLDGCWLRREQLPWPLLRLDPQATRASRVTHGICPDCAEQLR